MWKSQSFPQTNLPRGRVPAAPGLSVHAFPRSVSPAERAVAPGPTLPASRGWEEAELRARQALTSRELADNAHGDVGAGAGPPLPAAALDPVAAVVAQHAGAQARGPPVGVVHNRVVLPDQGASCGGEGTEGVRGGQTRQSRSRWERASLFEYPFSLPQVLTPHTPS